ncbi:MAG: ABC transporter substrate-binding protein [Desulfosarcina sp.]|nr:ABC transporter substrate-binding protein [Desulfobacterales bacterium]
MPRRPYLAVVVGALLAMLFSAGGAIAADKINYRLKWLFNTSVVGDLYANVHGHFKDARMEVNVKAGGPERDAIKELELGQAQFGVASADQVIRALDKGAPVVVIAQLFQINPLQWIYRRADPPINQLADLKGRVIGITYGGNDETIMRTLLAKAGLSEPEVKLFNVRYDYTPFYRRRVDIWPVYRNTQGVIIGRKMQADNAPVRFFIPGDYGVRFVANSVVTSQKMIRREPATVKRFIRALLAGWEAALDPANKERVLDVLQQFDKDTPRDLLVEQLEITRTLIKPTAELAIGTIDTAAWKQTEQIMRKQKQIAKSVRVETVLHPGFAF